MAMWLQKDSIWVVEQMKTTFPTAILMWGKYSIITVLSSDEGISKITMKKQEALFIVWGWNTVILAYWLVFSCSIILKNIADTWYVKDRYCCITQSATFRPGVLLISIYIFSALTY